MSISRITGQRTTRLALSYLSVIMTLSIAFSALIYFVTTAQLDRPLPPRDQQQTSQFDDQLFEDRLEIRDQATRESIIVSLIILNACMVIGGYAVSYAMARRTLAPIEASIEAQARFVSDASHELRTPLTALQTSNEVAQRKSQLSKERVAKLLDQNIAEIKKMRQLTDQLLQLDGATNIVQEPSDLSSIVEDTVALVQPNAEQKSINISAEITHNRTIEYADDMSKIVKIFLDNAITYAPSQSTIEVKDTPTKRQLQIVDSGPGVADEHKLEIFKRFYRIDSARTRSDAQNHGLGLSIAKSIADKNGWQLSVKDNKPNGSIFVIEFS